MTECHVDSLTLAIPYGSKLQKHSPSNHVTLKNLEQSKDLHLGVTAILALPG